VSARPAAALSGDQLARHLDLLRTALDLESMAAWSWDRRPDRMRVEFRAAAADFLRGSRPTLSAFLSQVHPDDRRRVTNRVNEALRRDGIHRVEFRFTGPDGRQRWLSSAFKRFLDARGRPAGLVGASRDITVRKDFYRELAESEARLRTVLETEPECVKLIDGPGIVRMMNPAGLAMVEADAEGDVIGRQALGLVAPEHRAAFADFHERVMAGHTEVLEFEIIGLKGTRRWMESRAAPLRNAAGGIVGQLAVARDVTERRALSRAIIETASREQERIGHDLHDGLGQELTGIALMLKGLQAQLDRPRAELERDVEEILQLANHALQSARAIARGLSPVALERGGLAEALRLLVAGARESTPAKLRLTIRSSMEELLDLPVRLHLYRIAQEALGNAVRHAGARRISISVDKARHRVRLRVTDDGKGLPARGGTGDGLGQRIMRYRAQLIGASIEFLRRPAGGTAVVVQWPARPGRKVAP
jgi:PAS domain S-box-containing protein